MLYHIKQHGAAPWVEKLFCNKLTFQSLALPVPFRALWLGDLTDVQLARYVEVLHWLPEGPEMAEYHASEIGNFFDESVANQHSPQRRALIQEIRDMYRKPEPPTDQSDDASAPVED